MGVRFVLAYTGALRTTETTSVVAMCSGLRVLYHSETQKPAESVYLLQYDGVLHNIFSS